MTTVSEKEDVDAALHAAGEAMDRDERAMLLYTLDTMRKYKSKGAQTLRWREFERWFKARRAEKAAA